MRKQTYILYLLATLMLAGCGMKKKTVPSAGGPLPDQASAPVWQTSLIQGARATVRHNNSKITSSVTMQVIRDSVLVISVMPMFGIETMRLEATPEELVAINKLEGQYARVTYDELNRKLTPELDWKTLQQVCSAEIPGGSEHARLQYHFGKDIIELVIDYPPRQTDIPVRADRLPLNRYNQTDISKWL